MAMIGKPRSAMRASGARQLTWYLGAKAALQYRNPPDYVPVSFNLQALKGASSGQTAAMRAQSMEFLMDQGIMIYGTPDSVVKQIRRLYDLVDGFDHLLMMRQADSLDHASTVKP
jgi:alkanesulfonate monooxygenase SsuD/methylene tetrahydromethanopterin reductase-like flavin-dependent oxidoreductase (luciferase family)